MSQREPDQNSSSLSDLTSDISALFRDHIALLKSELKTDLEYLGQESGVILLCAAGIATGYLMFNVAIVLLAGWLTNSFIMTGTAFVLAFINLGASSYILINKLESLQNFELLLESKREIERSQTWLKQNRPKALPKRDEKSKKTTDLPSKSKPQSKKPVDKSVEK